MKTVTARLDITVCVDCPNCDFLIDILTSSDTNGYDHNEEGYTINQACPDGKCWSEEHDNFDVEDITCSMCKEPFNVKGLFW